MFGWIEKILYSKLLQSILRKVMVFVAGWLASVGVPAETITQFTESTTAIIIAVLLYLVAQGWSLLEKKLNA
jgi:hypothetical protein